MKQEQIKRMEEAIAADYKNMVGMVIIKDGEMVYENYYNGCSADSRIHVFSVTKSIVSILIGIAVDKGLIKSIEDKVLDYVKGIVTADVKEVTREELALLNDNAAPAKPAKKKAPAKKAAKAEEEKPAKKKTAKAKAE